MEQANHSNVKEGRSWSNDAPNEEVESEEEGLLILGRYLSKWYLSSKATISWSEQIRGGLNKVASSKASKTFAIVFFSTHL